MIAFPIILAARDAPDWKIAFAAVVGAVIIYRHWKNVKRLFTGKEPLVRR
jgi:glycerol-3-phosphate acyltransferase PlsY